jgi:hypothetical protein
MGVVTGKHEIFFNAFDSYNDVVKALYNSKLQDPEINVDMLIESSRTAYLKTGASMTPKAHVAFTHTKEALTIAHGRNLGYLSEQFGEALHQRFDKVWKRYKVSSEVSDQYGPNLLKLVIDCSPKNI